jgi:hypothetical protein|uniref:Uncharacterized protein n=1 Tax=MELD virus sp. TaxID=2834287 RepID=A0A8S5L5M5_9VIRU|nr:MAG TPA: hypothetical protein [MELD virus sp.]
MSIPFTVDVSAFYGSPSQGEQSSNIIIDKRKTLNLHKKINQPVTKKSRKNKKETGGAIGMQDPQGGAIAMKEGSAIAFNEQQLMNELTGLKKGSALPTLAATIIPTLIEMAPQIISAIKSMKKGGAIKVGGASAVFLDGVDPSKYEDMIKVMKSIDRQRKNLIKEGGAIKVGSGKMGTFFKNAWSNIKSWYGNNADKLKPITDILLNSAVNSANKMIDKGVNYVADKTGSDTMRQIGNVVGNMAKNTVQNTASAVQYYKGGTLPSSYDIDQLDNTTVPKTVASKKKKILTSFVNNDHVQTESAIPVKKSKSVYS